MLPEPDGSPSGLRARIFEIIDDNRRSNRLARAFDVSIILLILVNVGASVLETVPAIDAEWGPQLRLLDRACVLIFVVEYGLRLWTAPEHPMLANLRPWRARTRHAFTPLMLLDFAVIAPFFIEMIAGVDLGVFRVLRIVRFYRLARYVPALSTLAAVIVSESRALVGSAVIFAGVLLLCAVMMHLVEGAAQPDHFGDIPSAMWWAVVTLSTVGYGDVVPLTAAGRVVAGVTIIFGLVLFALPVGIIANGFQQQIKRRDFVVNFGMVARVPLFKQLDVATIASLVNLLIARKVPAGAVVMARGDEAADMCFIASGAVEVETPHGPVRLDEGAFFGEIALLKENTRRTATVRTVRPSELLVLDVRDFRRLMRANPELAEAIRQVADERLADLGGKK